MDCKIVTVGGFDSEYKGKYVSKDINKCIEYLERGRKQKYGPAVLELARFYEEGIGVEKNIQIANELKEEEKNIVID